MIANQFRDAQNYFLPSYFQNGAFWNLSLSVYVHTIPVALVGKTILATRATSALVSVFGTLAVALMLKTVFRAQTWWSAILFLAAMPAWFLHSRTAFETVLMVSFYAGFLCFYLLYRYRATCFLFPALLFGAMTFYAYANGQAVMALTGILLALSDFRYHLKNWRVTLPGMVFVILLAAPYLRFRLDHPDEVAHHLRILNSYWLQNIPTSDKIVNLLTRWTYGASPQYWFFPNLQDLERHRLNDYGHFAWWMLPFFLLGLAICLRHLKSSAHRTLLIAALVTPFGSALAEVGITRTLAFVVPAAAFMALGLDALLTRLRATRTRQAVATICFALLTVWNFGMLGDALINGPTWFTNYGLYGMQWGAKQIFQDFVPAHLQAFPDDHLHVSHSWTNGANVLTRFFNLDPTRVDMTTIEAWLNRQQGLSEHDVFVMTREEFALANASNKLADISIQDVIPFPDRSEGFYIARLRYVENAEALFATERFAMQQPVVETITLNDESIQISHTPFDGGTAQQMFDGDLYTVTRGIETNPLELEFMFQSPRPIRAVGGWFGKVRYTLSATLFDENGASTHYQQTFDSLNVASSSPAGNPGEIIFDHGATRVAKMRVEITYAEAGNSAHIHIFDLILR